MRSAEQQQQDYEDRLRYSQCTREHGITDFPDPRVPAEGPDVNSNSAGDGEQGRAIDPLSPQFRSAHNACLDLLPEGDEGPSLNEGS